MIKVLSTALFNNLIKAEEELKNIREYEELPEAAVKLCYTDVSGNNYYEYENILEIKSVRSVAAEIKSKQLALSLTIEQEKEMFEKVFEHINNEDFVSAIHILRDCYHRVNYYGTIDTILDLATVYYLMEGEEANSYSEKWRQKKLKAWRDDEKAQCFFLSKAWQLTAISGSISDQDIQNYLMQISPQEEVFWDQIQS